VLERSSQRLLHQRKPSRLFEARNVVDAVCGFIVRPQKPRGPKSRFALSLQRSEHQDLADAAAALVGGDADTIITADMLPEEIVSPVPLSPNGSGGEHLMSLPLRDAREIFEREYLLAQVNRFGGNISRTAEFVGMERSALHRKLRALGVNSTERGTAIR